MTTRQYLNALKTLELTPFGVETRKVLGLRHRQLARLAAGDTEPSPMLARLLEALIALKSD